MAQDLKVLSVKLPLSDVRRISVNRSEFVRQAVAEKLARESGPAWRPKTATGRKLLKLRSQFLAQGGELLDADGIAKELGRMENGVSDYPTPPLLTAAQVKSIYGRAGKEQDQEQKFGRAAFAAVRRAARVR